MNNGVQPLTRPLVLGAVATTLIALALIVAVVAAVAIRSLDPALIGQMAGAYHNFAALLAAGYHDCFIGAAGYHDC